MPFDSVPQKKMTLARLSVVLRDQSQWPLGFEWHYGECSSCAMGLAYLLKNHKSIDDETSISAITNAVRRAIADAKAMSDEDFDRIFWNLELKYDGDITPAHVADEIDAYLAWLAQ